MLDDVLELKSRRRFVWLGRSGDMINIAGKRASLAYLNHQIASIPGVVAPFSSCRTRTLPGR